MKTSICTCGWTVFNMSTTNKSIKCPKCHSLIDCSGTPKTIGLGDIIESILNLFGGKQFKNLYHYIFKKDCGCDKRKEQLNKWTFFKKK